MSQWSYILAQGITLTGRQFTYWHYMRVSTWVKKTFDVLCIMVFMWRWRLLTLRMDPFLLNNTYCMIIWFQTCMYHICWWLWRNIETPWFSFFDIQFVDDHYFRNKSFTLCLLTTMNKILIKLKIKKIKQKL